MSIKTKRYNISFVVNKHLCTGCGACAGVCPHNAIKLELNKFGYYAPKVNKKKCTNCEICVKICPGHEFDYHQMHRNIFGQLPNNIALGPTINTYCGYTNDDEILKKAQSGGFVSTILIYALEKGLIDGAIVSRRKPNSQLEPETFIAKNREEILSAVGSIYHPIPAAKILKDVASTPGKFAFVGTSCQIQGMRKAELVFPKTEEKIAFYLGLHCLGVFTYHFQDQILSKIKLKKEEVAYYRHRDKAWKGWPCDMRIIDNKETTYNLDAKFSRLHPRPFFTLWRCQLCFDKANEFSDISCGDCRIKTEHKNLLQKGYDIKKGISEVVTRTNRGNKLVENAINDGSLNFYPVDQDQLCASIGVSGKKLGLNTFTKIARLVRTGVPYYGVVFSLNHIKPSNSLKMLKPWEVFSSSYYYFIYILNKHRFFRLILKKIKHKHIKAIVRVLGIKNSWLKYSNISALKSTVNSKHSKLSSHDY